MNIDDYRYITTIAELKSFTNAAKQLYIAQPSLSQRVKHIEDSYNIIIFIRDSKKGIYLTEEGECFVRYAKKILQAEEDLQKELADMHDLKNNALRIGTSQLINSSLFDSIIMRYHEKNPDVHFEFIQRTTSEVKKMLQNGEIDVAICYLPIQYDSLKYRVILEDRIVLVPAKGGVLAEKIAAAGKKPGDFVDLKMLDGEVFAANAPGTRLNEFITSLPVKYDVHPNIQHISRNYASLYSIARAGIASTLLLESYFSLDEEYEPFYYLNGAPDDLSIAIAWRSNTYLLKTVKDMIDIAEGAYY